MSTIYFNNLGSDRGLSITFVFFCMATCLSRFKLNPRSRTNFHCFSSKRSLTFHRIHFLSCFFLIRTKKEKLVWHSVHQNSTGKMLADTVIMTTAIIMIIAIMMIKLCHFTENTLKCECVLCHYVTVIFYTVVVIPFMLLFFLFRCVNTTFACRRF